LTDPSAPLLADDAHLAPHELDLRLRHAELIARPGHTILDEHGRRVIHCSSEAAEILAAEPEEVVASEGGLVDFLATEDRSRRDSALAAAKTAQSHFDEVFRLRGSERDARLLREVCEAIRDRHGNAIVWISTLQDVRATQFNDNEERRYERALAQAIRRATLAETTSAIAHELNQPLTAITNYASGCLRRLEAGQISQDEILEIMQLLRQQAQRASGIVRSVGNAVESTSNGRYAAQAEAVVQSLLHSLGHLFADLRIAVNVRFGTALPQVAMAPIDLAQVLTNIFENSIEAMEDSENAPRSLTISCQAKGNEHVEIRVEDTGHGFATDSTATFFRPFVSTKTGGLGMGLAISKSIIEAHGGQIAMTRGDKQGAVVHMLLPALGESGDDGT